jgi:hypothetical protein
MRDGPAISLFFLRCKLLDFFWKNPVILTRRQRRIPGKLSFIQQDFSEMYQIAGVGKSPLHDENPKKSRNRGFVLKNDVF